MFYCADNNTPSPHCKLPDLTIYSSSTICKDALHPLVTLGGRTLIHTDWLQGFGILSVLSSDLGLLALNC